MKKLSLLLISVFSFIINTNAQISTKEEPISFSYDQSQASIVYKSIDKRTLPVLDMEAINREDAEDEKYDLPPRFGFSHKVDFTLVNSGTWQVLPDGSKLWHLLIVCPNALSINLLYDKFWIPEDGKLFIFTPDKKQFIGAFTSMNNKGDKHDLQGFATELLYGDEIILEYYQPKECTEDAIISISNVIHGYRYISFESKSLNGSGSCQVNINCSEGDNWQMEKRAVAMILVNGNRICTGSLVTTTTDSHDPLLLTADHCVNAYGDAITSPSLNNWSFYWNYEAPGCSNISYEPTHTTTTGATIKANNSSSDFALLQLTEDPKNVITPFYLGWDRSGNSGSGGVGIHHPSGDVKKISTYTMSPVSCDYEGNTLNPSGSYWRVNWVSTSHGYGTTEGGSSGSALINSSHKIIGQLWGGLSSCSNQSASDWYGKFSVSWTGNGSSTPQKRLSNWLNPSNSSIQSKIGSFPSYGTYKQEACTFYGVSSSAISERNILVSYPMSVHQGCTVTMKSEYFKYLSISHSGVTPLSWSHSGNTVHFSMPYSSSTNQLNVKIGSGTSYEFDLYFFGWPPGSSYPINVFITPEGGCYHIFLVPNEDYHDFENSVRDGNESYTNKQLEVQEWLLEIFEVISGKIVISEKQNGSDYIINNSVLPSGIYVVKVTVNGQTFTEKITVK